MPPVISPNYPHSTLSLFGNIRGWAVNPWTVGALLVAMLMAVPIAAVVVLAVAPSDDIWEHLVSTVLWKYTKTTLILMVGVGVGVSLIGTGTAWLVTMCRFPGRNIFNWALLLPLAVPAYVLAFVITDQLEYAGTIQTLLRHLFGWTNRQDYWFPEIRSLGGATIVMTLVLYPYVYLLARAAFLEQSICVLDVSRTLGKGPWQTFFRVALPLARPAIVIGITLALMETLNDLGTVEFFAVRTFTAGIYDVWLNMNSRSGAAQLATVMLTFAITLIAAERMARRGRRFHHTSSKYSALPSYPLSGIRAAGAFVACLLPITLGFLAPAAVLTVYAVRYYEDTLSANYFDFVANSFTLSTSAAVGSVMVGLFMAYAVRLSNNPLLRAATRFASIGYAVPGAILAIGIIIPMGAFDNAIDAFSRETFGVSTGLLFSGTIVAVIYGYMARFLALSYGTMEASLAKITPNMDGAARTLGHGPLATLKRVHFPLMRGSLLTAGLLVFVDCMKELPLTMILRPFNYDTLATFVFQYASDELLEESALGALTIVAAGIIPVILLSWNIVHSRPGSGSTAVEPGA